MRIRDLMDQRGVTVKMVAAHLGLASGNAVYKWERGQCLPTIDSMVMLTDILECSLDDLIAIKEY